MKNEKEIKKHQDRIREEKVKRQSPKRFGEEFSDEPIPHSELEEDLPPERL